MTFYCACWQFRVCSPKVCCYFCVSLLGEHTISAFHNLVFQADVNFIILVFRANHQLISASDGLFVEIYESGNWFVGYWVRPWLHLHPTLSWSKLYMLVGPSTISIENWALSNQKFLASVKWFSVNHWDGISRTHTRFKFKAGKILPFRLMINWIDNISCPHRKTIKLSK